MDLSNWQTQLRKGLLELYILNLLSQGESHGYEMVRTLKRSDSLKIREGNIYPILARLQTDGLVHVRKQASQSGPPRKYYMLSDLGHERVANMNKHWDDITSHIKQIRKGSVK